MHGVLFLVRHLTAVALLAGAAYFYGRLVARRLPFRDGFEQTVISIALGLGLLASLLNLLGLADALTRPAVALVIAAPLVLRIAGRRAFEGRLLSSFDRTTRLGAILLVMPILAALGLALYPPTAFDATLYHLPIAKAFARDHAIHFLPDLRFPVSPQLYEMLYAGSLALSDDITAQLAHFLALALTSAALIAWGRRFATPRAGVWAAAAWLGNPVVLAVGGVAMVDVGLALFCTMALYAWQTWREGGDARWLGASAAFAGLAASTKYLGLFFVAALAVATVFADRPHGGLRRAAQYGGIALLVLAPFYWRIVSQTGNPVFPYLSRWFGDSAWSEWLDPIAANNPQGASGGSLLGSRARSLMDPRALLREIWTLVDPAAGLGGRAIVSPLLLLLLPFLCWHALRDPRARFLLILGLGYGACWYLLCPDGRFLLPILPAWTAGAAAGADALLRRREGAGRQRAHGELATAALALLLVMPGTAWTARALRRQGRLPVTAQQRDAYLTRSFPVYPALQILNEAFGSHYAVYVLFRENAAYFADGRFLGDHFGPNRFSRVTDALDDPRRLLTVLRRMGVTHLLIDRTEGSGARVSLSALATSFRRLPAPAGTALFTLGEEKRRSSVPSAPQP
ncbi:MAG TPA: glycosyltransferase family 39 protein [Thermoanaerobaculia bacterium]|nr:glycosyltransferase family 39 protein [Thermoanaerobaculia bacterium]